jgi:L-iditol 2-dehydrogenase
VTEENLAAVLYGVKDLRIEQRAVPQPGPHEVLVRVASVGVCGSDVHYYEHGRIGDFIVRKPLVLGHEASGTVVAQGRQATQVPVGTRVALEPGVPCGQCSSCRTGRYNLCPDVRFFATPPVDGAFARYVTIDENFAHPIPDSIDEDSGALIEPLSVGVWANRKAGTAIGSRVIVTGAGPIGILCGLVARAAGAAHVTILDVNRDRLRQASALGLDEALDARAGTPLAEADVLLECTGVDSVARAGIQALRPAGTAVLVGMGAHAEAPLPVAAIQAKEITVTGTFRYANTYPEAIGLVASGRLSLAGIIGARLTLNETERALRMGHEDPTVLKTVVVLGD